MRGIPGGARSPDHGRKGIGNGGGAATPENREVVTVDRIYELIERIEELSPRRGAVFYGLFMTFWVVGFAGTDHPLPGVVVAVLLVLPAAVHFGIGYVVREWWALYLTAVPVVVSAVAGGLPSSLWASVVLLTAFPGAPLVAAGVWLRNWLERRDPSYVDPWLI